MKTKKILMQEGFTLIEMLVVVMLIGAIAAFVGGNIMASFNKAKVQNTKTQMRQLGSALDQFKLECGFYPTTDQTLEALLTKPTGRECKNYDPQGYLGGKKVPQDAFSNAFVYESDGNKYEIKSLGNDRKDGGEGLDKDLSTNDVE